MKENSFQEFINKLNVQIPSEEEFEKLGDLTALFKTQSDNFIRLNYERGMLLYAIIARYKPKNIIEFGTASGYATLCMARAMDDYKIDGRIFTIDIESERQSFERPIDWGFGPKMEKISRKELWNKVAKKNWLNKIEVLRGYSAEIMSNKKLPKFQFAYIDGPHFFKGVQHDFYSFLKVADSEFFVLFDDYISRPSYGVKKLVDNEINDYFNPILIHTDRKRYILEMNLTTDPKYGMVWINSNDVKKSLDSLFTNGNLDKIIKKYRKYEKRLKLRGKINQKIPFLKKIRFQYWKNKN